MAFIIATDLQDTLARNIKDALDAARQCKRQDIKLNGRFMQACTKVKTAYDMGVIEIDVLIDAVIVYLQSLPRRDVNTNFGCKIQQAHRAMILPIKKMYIEFAFQKDVYDMDTINRIIEMDFRTRSSRDFILHSYFAAGKQVFDRGPKIFRKRKPTKWPVEAVIGPSNKYG